MRVFDLGETESGDPYIVMELLEGESLRSMLDREVRLTPERALANAVLFSEIGGGASPAASSSNLGTPGTSAHEAVDGR